MNKAATYLKNRREHLGLSHKQVADSLMLKPEVIVQIEEGDLTKIENLVYFKGFLKNYCKILHVDYESLKRIYFNEKWAQKNKNKEEKKTFSYKNKIKIVIFVLLLLTVIGVTLIIVNQIVNFGPKKAPSVIGYEKFKNSPLHQHNIYKIDNNGN